MKRLYLFLWLFIGWAPAGWAQRTGTTNVFKPSGGSTAPTTSTSTTNIVGPGGGGGTTPIVQPSRWQQHADSIFQHLDRSQVSTGLLTNYGFALKDYNSYQGTALGTTNLLQNLGEWRLLYGALQTSVYNNNATLPALSTANFRIQQAEQQAPDVVGIATLLARYDRFRNDAGTARLITVSNNQLYDAPNRPYSPYEQRTLVALSPLASKVATRSPQFSFPSQLLFTNAAPAITALEFDAGEGQGYRSVSWDQPFTATYPANGTYTLRFRLTCANGTVLLSQARFDVNQPPAARYQPTGSANVVTYNSNSLFTDTRPYAPANVFLPTYAATGQITVAYADGNTTGTIRKPLIVIEGYDPSAALRANGLSARAAPDYDYNSFAFGQIFGGVFTSFNPINPGDRSIFNDQLSEVGQYDLIFLNFSKGTDFIQRNAFLVERLIQWVNDNKQPLNGFRQQNIVVGMSMGGLVARYALRDMEQRQASGAASFSHDTKLYISHEAPHQGANVPLGVQYAVSSLVNSNLGFGFTAADFSPQLKAFSKLLDEPATQQLLIYQTTSSGTNLHNTWLNEYNTMGYPTQCRNVATSDGSECGRPQDFAPYAELLNIQGGGLLDEPYNGYANVALLGTGMLVGVGLSFVLGPAALFAGFAAGVIMAMGNFEGHADFVVNALPSQRRERIYHGKFSICKDILFGLFTTCLVDYSDNRYSDASMLAYDSAPGGIYDLDQVSAGAIGQIGTALPIAQARVYAQPRFCFIPTTSALDIGGGSVALGPQNLLNSYSGANPPAAPFSSPFASFITASRENLTHILWNGLNSKWAFLEMLGAPQAFDCQAFCQLVPAITGDPGLCNNATVTYSVNAPAGSSVNWTMSPFGLVTTVNQSGNTITLQPSSTSGGGRLTLTATIGGDCGSISTTKAVGVGEIPIQLYPAPGQITFCRNEEVRIVMLNNPFITGDLTTPGNSISWRDNTNSGTVLYGQGSPETTWLTPSNGAPFVFTISITDACGTRTATTGGSAFYYGTPMACGQRAAEPTASIYPNPAKETVDVHVENADAAHPVTVRLFDSYGRPCAERTSRGDDATLRLNTEKLPAGLYFVHLLQGGKVVKREQLQIEK